MKKILTAIIAMFVLAMAGCDSDESAKDNQASQGPPCCLSEPPDIPEIEIPVDPAKVTPLEKGA